VNNVRRETRDPCRVSVCLRWHSDVLEHNFCVVDLPMRVGVVWDLRAALFHVRGFVDCTPQRQRFNTLVPAACILKVLTLQL
jgi:hypothetical protein